MPEHVLPYKIAVLCYLYDADGRLLLLHRVKPPNQGMYSPIGGKLDVATGESPHQCAQREIKEEAGVDVTLDDLHMTGIVAETAYEGATHWLIFLFEVTHPVSPDAITNMHFDEGVLEWIPYDQVMNLDIPETDREIIWPLVDQNRGGFFVVNIDCRRDALEWEVVEGRCEVRGASD